MSTRRPATLDGKSGVSRLAGPSREAQSGGNNRRASDRRAQRLPVTLRPPGERNVVSAVTVNVSEGGLLVELARRPARTPSFLVVDLDLGGAPSRVQAVVQRAEESRGKQRLALRFVDLGEHERHTLRMKLRS